MGFDPVFSRLKKLKRLEVVKFTPDFQDAITIKNLKPKIEEKSERGEKGS